MDPETQTQTETEPQVETAEEESPYYIVNIYDNHGTINITQTGKKDPPPPPPNL